MQGWCVNKYSFKPDWTHRCTPVGMILDHPVYSTVTEFPRKKHAAVSLQATVPPTDVHGTPKSLFPCGKCDKQYAQPQGVARHQREAHGKKSLCPNCNDFRWSRRHELTKHLKEQHPDVNLDATLCKATRYRREAAMNKKYLRRQQISPPSIVYTRRSHDNPVPRSLMYTLPAVAEDSHVSLPAVLPMAYDPHPESAEKPATSCKRENARLGWLDLFDPTINAPSQSSSTEEPLQPVNDAGMSVQHGRVWLAFLFLVGT